MNAARAPEGGLPRLLLPLIVLAPVVVGSAHAQPTSAVRSDGEHAMALLRQSRFAEAEEVFAEWVDVDSHNPDAHYGLALTRARLGNQSAALEGFHKVLALDARRADAYFEIAALLLKDGDRAQALDWADRGLQVAPEDQYGLDVMGTAHYVSGARLEALRYWNRRSRPLLTETRIVVAGDVTRQAVADELSLSPGDLLSLTELEKARWRLAQHGNIRSVVFDPVPGPSHDQYALDVRVNARSGVGSAAELLTNTLADVGFRTWRFTYWNLARSGMTVSTRWRWVPTAQWAEMELDVPRPAHLPLYASVSYSRRDELWELPASRPGFLLRTHNVGLSFVIPMRPPHLSLTVGMSGRKRRFQTPLGDQPGDSTPVNQLPDERVLRTVRFRAHPRVDLSRSGVPGGWDLHGHLEGAIELGRSRGDTGFQDSRFSFSSELRLARTVGGARRQSLALGLHGGRLSPNGLVEDHFVLGVGPDSEFSLRAHPYLRNGRPGTAPLAAGFLLGNLTTGTDVSSWKGVTVGVLASWMSPE